MFDAGGVGARLEVLRGAALDRIADRMLDRLVREAAIGLRVNGAALTIALRNTVVFRASWGLPADLFRTRQADRTCDPCVRVIAARDAVAIPDANRDLASRALLSAAGGARSYLGVPVALGGTIVGALAIYDDRPRVLDGEARALLERLAAACAKRLAELAAEPTASSELVLDAASTAFAELRNAMQPLDVNLETARAALAELAVEAARLRGETAIAVDRLRGALDAIDRHSDRVRNEVLALDRLLARDAEPATVGEIVRTSDLLANHDTRLAGGVHWQLAATEVVVDAAPAACVGVIVRALSLVALSASREGTTSGIAGRTEGGSGAVEVALSAPISQSELDRCTRELEDVAVRSALAVHRCEDALCIVLPAA